MRSVYRVPAVAALLVFIGCATPAQQAPAPTVHKLGSALSASSTETIDLSTTTRSSTRPAGNIDVIGCVLRNVGSAVGTWTFQVSNDASPSTDDTSWASWYVDQLSSSGTQSYYATISYVAWLYHRWKWTATSGTGTATILCNYRGG